MPKAKESAVEEYLVERTKETRGIHRKMKWPGRRGAPDHWCGWPHLNFYIIIELKEPEQDWGLQPHQRREIDRLKSCGMRVAVANGKEGVDAIFRFHNIHR